MENPAESFSFEIVERGSGYVKMAAKGVDDNLYSTKLIVLYHGNTDTATVDQVKESPAFPEAFRNWYEIEHIPGE